ncbi:MAG: di-trans,poly-cis-decaprenylcistransferase, partial [Anaerolineae bacterium]|nr:di-trans,poly-cis-decaprenylcistransferase [Anaerolineae bacterium]
EVRVLMSILEMVIDRELDELHREGVQIRHIGELDGIPKALQKKIQLAKELTQNNSRLILNVALNYGGRDEIVRAVRNIVRDGIPADQIDEALISSYMYTSPLPDPDLIIRTSGEMRLSNFLVWQGTYSEYYFAPTYWPDFNREELLRALVEYSQRTRRFGKTDEQLDSSPDR